MMDTVSASRVNETDRALEELSEGNIGFGIHTGTILLMHSDRGALDHYAKEVRKIFAQKFLTARMEEMGAFEAFLGSIPGNLNSGVRRKIISSQNLIDLLPIHADWTGNSINTHLSAVCGLGEPQFVCSTLGWQCVPI